jgi:hypothetical protein
MSEAAETDRVHVAEQLSLTEWMATTTYTYDYDYANRPTALFSAGATTRTAMTPSALASSRSAHHQPRRIRSSSIR